MAPTAASAVWKLARRGSLRTSGTVAHGMAGASSRVTLSSHQPADPASRPRGSEPRKGLPKWHTRAAGGVLISLSPESSQCFKALLKTTYGESPRPWHTACILLALSFIGLSDWPDVAGARVSQTRAPPTDHRDSENWRAAPRQLPTAIESTS